MDPTSSAGATAAPLDLAAPLQGAPSITGGGPLAIAGALVLAYLFYAVTLHLAARWVVGAGVPTQPAASAAVVPAVVSLLLQRWGPAVTVAATLIADVLAVRWAYERDWPAAVLLAVVHLAVAVAVGLAVLNLLRL